MLIFNNFSSLFSIMSHSWLLDVFISAFLMVLGWVYQFVSYCFKLFSLMCQINFNSIYNIMAPLIDRLEAVVMVLIMFKLAISLITYMFNPESAPKEGAGLVKNIAITAALLISYNFIFGVLNEISMIVIGSPEGYKFTYLSDLIDADTTGDEGLISRFIFGETDVADAGNYVAYKILSIFIYDTDSTDSSDTSSSTLSTVISDDGEVNFSLLPNMSTYVGKTVTYIPFIGTIMGAYLIYSVVKASIQIGVRMFKLILLQIVAPLAIVSIIKDGTKKGIFKKFIEMYIEVYLEAFTRMIAMLLSIVFISKFITNIGTNIGTFFSDSALSGDQSFITEGLLTIIVCVAGVRFAGEMPKMIDKLLGTHMADAKGGFGSYIGSLVGGGIGLAKGLASGAGIGAVGTAISGGRNMANVVGKGEGISSIIKGINETSKNSTETGIKIKKAGGAFNYAMQNHRVNSGANLRKISASENKISGYDKRITELSERNTDMTDVENQYIEAIKNNDSGFKFHGTTQAIQFGSDINTFAEQVASNDSTVTSYDADITNLETKLSDTNLSDAQRNAIAKDLAERRGQRNAAYINAQKHARSAYESELDKEATKNNDSSTVASRKAAQTANSAEIKSLGRQKTSEEKVKSDLEKGKI